MDFKEQKRKSNIKLYQVYYLLAAFDLITIFFSLHLGYKIHKIYEDSYIANQTWVNNLTTLDQYGTAIIKLNGPGNSVFNSFNVKKERDDFQRFHAEYHSIHEKILDISKSLNNRDGQIWLDSADENVQNLNEQAQLIFTYFAEGKEKVAATHMAQMDEFFTQATIDLGNIRLIFREAQKMHIENQHLKAKELFKQEGYVAIFIFIIILFVIYYGHKLKLKLQEHENLIEVQYATLANQSKLSSLGEMAGGIAHEINNPLTVINGNAHKIKRLIELGKLDNDVLIKAAMSIEQTTHRIKKIVNGLRSFARESDSDIYKWVGLDQVLTESLSFSESKLISHGVKISGFSNPEYCEIELNCNEVQLAQVIVNLLNNAYDAIENNENKWISVHHTISDDKLELFITDCGIGIPPEIIDKIMSPFFTTKPVGKGTGLGLGISHGIMQKHGGRIYVNTKCANTQFVLEFKNIRMKDKQAKAS